VLDVVFEKEVKVAWPNIVAEFAFDTLKRPTSANVVLPTFDANEACACQFGGFAESVEVTQVPIAIRVTSLPSKTSAVVGAAEAVPIASQPITCAV
jgi:hypothetical protein